MSRDLPPLNALRAFEATARLNSVSQAAELLHVTHGAVSRQLKVLEEHLGVSLFIRMGAALNSQMLASGYEMPAARLSSGCATCAPNSPNAALTRPSFLVVQAVCWRVGLSLGWGG